MLLKSKLLISIFILATLTACADPKEVVVTVPAPKIAITHPPKPAAISMKPVTFAVVTKDNISKLDAERVWYAITVDDYENLSSNTQEMLRYIKDQKSVIRYWEEVTK